MGNEVPLTSVGAKMASANSANSVGKDKPFTTRIIDNVSPIDDRMADERITDHNLTGIIEATEPLPHRNA